MKPDPTQIDIDLGVRSYPIYIGRGLLDGIEHYLGHNYPSSRLFVVTDDQVAPIYLSKLKDAVKIHAHYTLPAGEGSKNLDHWQDICLHFLSAGITRKDMIVALGGGVVGDIAGFAAASIMRGTGFIQIPTTLLAQVDSAVGGKTAVNTPAGKNLIGSFYQPQCVISDLSTLTTLPERQIRAGYGEVLKYALIDNPDFFNWLENNTDAVLQLDDNALAYAVGLSCRAKADIVSRDETEQGVRALLNLGHTFAHALEAEGGYDGRLLHGEAVLIGLDMALAASVHFGLAPVADLKRLRRHYETHDLWPEYQIQSSPAQLVTLMQGDKKHSAGQMTFILMHGIGQAFICRKRNASQIEDFLAQYLKER